MLVFLALLIWFALSVPATLVLGRVLAQAGRHAPVPIPPTRVLTSGHSLTRR
jgi:hypothetical protein